MEPDRSGTERTTARVADRAHAHAGSSVTHYSGEAGTFEASDALYAVGVSRIFGPGSSRDEIVEFVNWAGRASRSDRANEFSEAKS